MTREQLAHDYICALLHNPMIMQILPSRLDPKQGQMQIVIDVVAAGIGFADSFLEKTAQKTEKSTLVQP